MTSWSKISLFLASLSFVSQSIIFASNLFNPCILCPYIRCFRLLLAHINTVCCFYSFGFYNQVFDLTTSSLCWYCSWLSTSCWLFIISLTYSIQIKFILTSFNLLKSVLYFELIFVSKINQSLTKGSTDLKEHWYGKVAIFVKTSIRTTKRAL